MKFLVVMGGHCNRFKNIQYIYDNYLLKIKNPLLENGHTIDCIFNTYNGSDEYFEKFKELYNPIETFRTDPNNFKYINFYYGMINIQPFIKNYDKIIFLRFDLCYKMNIMKWNIFNDKGIGFTFKEDSEEGYNLMRCISEAVVVIDNEYFDQVYQAVHESIQYHVFNNKISENIPRGFDTYMELHGTLHQFMNVLLHKYGDFPIYFIINGYYQSITFHRYDMTINKLNPLYIMMSRDYFGDMSDYLLLERL
jgi:hypothetical protein